MSSGYDQIRSLAKTTGRIQHASDSDEQLREFVLDNMRIVSSLPASRVAEGYKLLGEIDACNEILKERQERRERVEKAKKDYLNSLERRRDDALLTLKAAATPNGQLVAAILEDEGGMTTEELAGWCDELASLDEAEFRDLLDDLAGDGILERKDGRYYLRVLCTEKVQWTAESAARYVERHFDEKRESLARTDMLAVIEHLRVQGEPLSAERCAELDKEYAELFGGSEGARTASSYNVEMRRLAKAGVLANVYNTGGVYGQCFDFALIERKEAAE